MVSAGKSRRVFTEPPGLNPGFLLQVDPAMIGRLDEINTGLGMPAIRT